MFAETIGQGAIERDGCSVHIRRVTQIAPSKEKVSRSRGHGDVSFRSEVCAAKRDPKESLLRLPVKALE